MEDEQAAAADAFAHALSALEECLGQGHWSEAGDAALALGEASAACAARGVRLSPEELEAALALYGRCIERAVDWGQALQAEAQAMGASSRALAGRAKDNPNFFITLAATAGGKFLPQIGGVLIRDSSGAILGAAGASGGTGEEDEAVCAHGIEQAGLVADAKP